MISFRAFSHHILLLFTVVILFGTKWQSSPIYIDEYASIFIVKGIPVNVFQEQRGYSYPQYANMTLEQIEKGNTLANVVKYNREDGGSGLPHYLIAHYVSLFLGKWIGVVNALRLLSVLFSLLLVWHYYHFSVLIFGKQIALITSLLLTFLLAKYGDYIRTYPLSNLIVFSFFCQFYQIAQALIVNQKVRLRNYVFLFSFGFLLTFCHFFNVCYLLVSVLLLLLFPHIFRQKMPTFVPTLCLLILPMIIFLVYYITNEAGRVYQATANEYWYELAQKFGTPANQWLPPATLKYLVIKNIELLLTTTGLDLRMMAQHWQIRYFGVLLLPILLSAFYVCKFLYLSLLSRKQAESVIGLIVMSYLICYLGFINLLCLIWGHTTALNSQWYSFSLLPFYVLGLAILLKNVKKRYFKLGFYIYLFIVIANTYTACLRCQSYENGAIHDQQLLRKIGRK